MYRVMAAEALGAEGELEKAAGEYLAAALESGDPEIAERATRVAIAAQAWQFAAMAADRWALLAPDSLDARQAAIRTLLIDGNFVAAEHQMDELLNQLSADPGRAWSVIAAELAAASNPEKSRAMLERLIQLRGAADNADALFAHSQLAARTGDLAEADRLAALAVAEEPGRGDLQAWAGRLAVNRQDMNRAIAHYGEAHRLRSDDRAIALAYAELLKRSGQVDRSLEVLGQLPDTPENRFARIAFALDAGREPLARALYDGFGPAAYTDTDEAAFQAAQAAEMLGDSVGAIGWYERVERGERALVAVLRRSVLMAEAGELEQARNLLSRTRMHRESGIRIESFLAESQILIDAGMAEAASELLTEAVQAEPGSTALRYTRALVAVQLDRLEQAEADLRTIIESEPRNAAALNALGYTLADRTDRLEEAEQLVHAAYALDPNDAAIIDSMGWVAYRRGRLDEAERFLQAAWQSDANPEIAAHLGEVLWQLGRVEEAREIWREGLGREPANEALLETMARFGEQP